MRVFSLALALLLAAPAASAQLTTGPPSAATPATQTPPPEPPSDARMTYRYRIQDNSVRPVSGRTSGDDGVHLGRWYGGQVAGQPSVIEQYALYEIRIAERGDRPCDIDVFGTRGTYTGSTVHEGFGSGCRGTARSRRSVGAPARPRGSPRAVIRGLQVCSNDRGGDRYRIKGLRVWMANAIESGDGQVVDVPGAPRQFARSNCRKWEQQRMCPGRQVMIGVRAYYKAGSLTGLAPVCGRLTHEPVSTP